MQARMVELEKAYTKQIDHASFLRNQLHVEQRRNNILRRRNFFLRRKWWNRLWMRIKGKAKK